MLLCKSKVAPDSFRETRSSIVHCTEEIDKHLQFECIGVDTAHRTPVREVPMQSDQSQKTLELGSNLNFH